MENYLKRIERTTRTPERKFPTKILVSVVVLLFDWFRSFDVTYKYRL